MGRILAIDYGTKRVGLAVSDPMKIISSPLTTVATSQALKYISEYISANEVEMILIGYPTDLSGNATHATPHVNGFIAKLKEKFPAVPLKKWDESFTSKLAAQTLAESGRKKKDRRNKALLDSVSAAIILQEYLGHH